MPTCEPFSNAYLDKLFELKSVINKMEPNCKTQTSAEERRGIHINNGLLSYFYKKDNKALVLDSNFEELYNLLVKKVESYCNVISDPNLTSLALQYYTNETSIEEHIDGCYMTVIILQDEDNSLQINNKGIPKTNSKYKLVTLNSWLRFVISGGNCKPNLHSVLPSTDRVSLVLRFYPKNDALPIADYIREFRSFAVSLTSSN